MGKVLALLLIILLAITSVAGYLFLNKKIIVGERQIAYGQRELEKGQLALDKGKDKLDVGKRKLSEGKKEYEQSKNSLFLVLADKLLIGQNGFNKAREQIIKGEKQTAQGGDKVSAGERQLDAAQLQLRQGLEQLRLAKFALVACAFGAAFFSSLSVVLGFCWRRSLHASLYIYNLA